MMRPPGTASSCCNATLLFLLVLSVCHTPAHSKSTSEDIEIVAGAEEVMYEWAGIDCSRSDSRLVRRYLEAEIWPRLKATDVAGSLPSECPLNPRLDMYLAQEKKKVKKSKNEYKCGICGKIFRTEYYLDKHMDLKHGDHIDTEMDTCLADFCQIFGCGHKLVEKPTGIQHLHVSERIVFLNRHLSDKAQY